MKKWLERRKVQADEPVAGIWPAGQPVTLRGQLVIPAQAPPSFSTHNHTLRWTAHARVSLAGSPDLSLRQPVQVVAEGRREVESEERTSQSLQDDGLQGELRLYARSVQGVPAVQPGGRVRGELTLSLSEEGARQISVMLTRLLHGSGTAEESNVQELGLMPSSPAPFATLDWTVPQTGELSYAGRHVKCDWQVHVKLDRPGRDRHLRFPLLVTTLDEI